MEAHIGEDGAGHQLPKARLGREKSGDRLMIDVVEIEGERRCEDRRHDREKVQAQPPADPKDQGKGEVELLFDRQ